MRLGEKKRVKDEQLALAWWALRLSEICGFSPFLYCLLSYRGIPPTGNRSSLLQIMGARLFSSLVRPMQKESSRISVLPMLPISSLLKRMTKLLMTSFLDNIKVKRA